MKSVIRVFTRAMILLLLLLSLCACDAIGDLLDTGDSKKTPTEGLTFTLADNGRAYIVSGYTGEDTEVTIPSKHEGKKVTAIGVNAFRDCEKITSVTVPSTVKTIGRAAFSGCESLKEVTIPSSVTSIGEEAFKECRDLLSVTLPKSVETVGANAFQTCTLLLVYVEADTKPTDWDSDWNTSGRPVIWGHKSNSTASDGYIYTVVDGLRYALKEEKARVEKQLDTEAVSVSIRESVSYEGKTYSVTAIGARAFASNEKMTEVTIPASVTMISAKAFSGCTALSSVTIPTSVESIGSYAFSDCTALSSVTIPASVKTIGSYAFSGCTALKRIQIPNTVEELGYDVFLRCEDLVIYTPLLKRPTEWSTGWNAAGHLAVWGWNNGRPATDGRIYEAVDGVVYSLSNGKATVLRTAGYAKTVTIPETVTVGGATYTVAYIADRAFINHELLCEIVIPKTVKSIGQNAFCGCVELASAEILGDGVDIGAGAFEDCKKLTAVTASSVGTVGENAFYDCIALQSITLASAESIGEHAFFGCRALEVAILASPQYIDGFAFSGCPKLTIYTDCEKSQVEWDRLWNGSSPVVWGMSLGDACVMIDGVLYVLEDNMATVTRQPSGIVTARIPETVTYLEKTYPVKAIADGAFESCVALTTVTIPNAVESIGKNAFRNCTALFSVSLGKDSGCKSIGDSAFSGCSALYSLVLPTSITSIGRGVFVDCTSLTVYARHTSAPSGWRTDWNCGRPVKWGAR